MTMKYKLISITSALLLSLSVVASNETITIGDVEMASDAKSAAFEQVKMGRYYGPRSKRSRYRCFL